MARKSADVLKLAGGPGPGLGLLPSGKPRRLPYRPRNRKKLPPELIRSAVASLRFTPECRDFLYAAAEAQGLDVSLFVYNAAVHYAALCRFAQAPPPYDPKARADAPMLPGLTADDPPAR